MLAISGNEKTVLLQRPGIHGFIKDRIVRVKNQALRSDLAALISELIASWDKGAVPPARGGVAEAPAVAGARGDRNAGGDRVGYIAADPPAAVPPLPGAARTQRSPRESQF